MSNTVLNQPLKPLKELQPAVDRSPLWLKINAGLLLCLLGTTVLAIHKPPKYLVQDTDGQITVVQPGKNVEKAIPDFVKKVIPLLFWYSDKPKAELGLADQAGNTDQTYVFGDLKIWVPNALASYSLSPKLQSAILKGLAHDYYPLIKQWQAAEALVKVDYTTKPRSLGNGRWQLEMAAGRYFFGKGGQMLHQSPYNIRLEVLQVEPPALPLGGISVFDPLVYTYRQAGLQIDDIQEIEEIKKQ
jgi:hypothetical protein